MVKDRSIPPRKRGRPAQQLKRSQPALPGLNPSLALPAPGPMRTASHHLAPAKVTEVFNSYWKFAAERQRIFYKRVSGSPGPWSEHSILNTFKFTNAYRASDRASQYLIRNVIYRSDLPSTPKEVIFRILLFKLFNKIQTWQLLEAAFGVVRFADYNFKRIDKLLTEAMAKGSRIYSAAYIMPPGGTTFGHKLKHQNHLKLLEAMMSDGLADKLATAKTMQQGFEMLRSYPTIGDFLAYQFITDINYSEVINFSEMDFVVPGPGARDGIRKCFSETGGLSEPEIIRLVADRQEAEFERLGIKFPSLWGRRLQLIDCQNLFCEIDKFARVAHPEASGRTGRTRIKQKFSAHTQKLDFWYPPKWGLNDRIASDSIPNEAFAKSPFARQKVSTNS